MRDIGPDRLSDDGRLLILRDADTGETFGTPVDAVRGLLEAADRVARATRRTEKTMDTPTLSPRDIQARIRRGESPQQVADSAGVEVDAVATFAGPVLAEREYMAEQARRTTIRRRHATGTGVQLGAVVDEHLAGQGVPPESVHWDAWRREDGRWTVAVTPPDAPEAATFVYDTKGRYVVPGDETAHDLVGDVALPEQTNMAIADAIREREADAPSAGPDVGPVEETPAVEAVVVEPVDDEPRAAVSSLAEARDRRALEQQALAAQQTNEPTPAPEQDSLDDLFAQADDEESHVAVNDSVAPRKKKQERRRVPSWDEIMFGGRDD